MEGGPLGTQAAWEVAWGNPELSGGGGVSLENSTLSLGGLVVEEETVTGPIPALGVPGGLGSRQRPETVHFGIQACLLPFQAPLSLEVEAVQALARAPG